MYIDTDDRVLAPAGKQTPDRRPLAEYLQELADRKQKTQAETNALFARALLSNHIDNEDARQADIEAAQDEAAKEVIKRYEAQKGIKSDETKQRDKALYEMAKELKEKQQQADKARRERYGWHT